jgi:hypothetical protein
MIWGVLIGKVRGWVIGAGVILAGFLLAYFKGRKDTEQEHEVEELNEYVETRKRMDAVDVPDAEQWLRERRNKRNL